MGTATDTNAASRETDSFGATEQAVGSVSDTVDGRDTTMAIRLTGAKAATGKTRWLPAAAAAVVVLLFLVAGAGAVSLIAAPRANPDQSTPQPLWDWVAWSLRIHLPVEQKPTEPTVKQQAVTALGRLEPEGEVVKLSVPAFLKDERVFQVLIKQGDRVHTGQPVCVLDSRRRLSAALKEAIEQVRIARAKLARVTAGAKKGEINAQRAHIESLRFDLRSKLKAQEAIIARLRAEVEFSETEQSRYASLYADGAISASQLDSKELALSKATASLNEALAERERIRDTLAARIDEAQATLERIAEVRPVDVTVAQMEVEEAMARVQKIRTDLDLAQVRAPRSGRILKVHVRPGETVTDKGIAEIGRTDRMVAVAEVHQSDVSQVKPGQRATITGDGFTAQLHGSVYQLGWQVIRQNVFAQEPSASNDRRVVEVKVLLDPQDSRQVAGLTNMQVIVSIDTGS